MHIHMKLNAIEMSATWFWDSIGLIHICHFMAIHTLKADNKIEEEQQPMCSMTETKQPNWMDFVRK